MIIVKLTFVLALLGQGGVLECIHSILGLFLGFELMVDQYQVLDYECWFPVAKGRSPFKTSHGKTHCFCFGGDRSFDHIFLPAYGIEFIYMKTVFVNHDLILY